MLRHQLIVPPKQNTAKPAKPLAISPQPKPSEPLQSITSSGTTFSPSIGSVNEIEPSSPKAAPVSQPRDLGRGGIQHKTIQQRLKSGAEELGFRAIIEKEVLNGAGSIDLVLERTPLRFACEITITTTIDQEVGNALKCIRAGFDRVVMISTTQERLQKLSAAISNSLGQEAFARVSFYLPDEFLAYLRGLEVKPMPASAPTTSAEATFKVKRNLVHLGSQEMKAREAEAIRLIAESMKRKK